jgi:hypothetical protein
MKWILQSKFIYKYFYKNTSLLLHLFCIYLLFKHLIQGQFENIYLPVYTIYSMYKTDGIASSPLNAVLLAMTV